MLSKYQQGFGNVKINKVDKEDIILIKPMWEELNKHHQKLSTNFKEHFSSFTFEDRQKQIEKNDLFAVFIAEDEGNFIGYCIASIDGKIGEIDSIFVNPGYRQKNLGESLMLEAETWLKAQDIEKIHILVAQGNESVFHFYNKQGYKKRFTVLEKTAL